MDTCVSTGRRAVCMLEIDCVRILIDSVQLWCLRWMDFIFALAQLHLDSQIEFCFCDRLIWLLKLMAKCNRNWVTAGFSIMLFQYDLFTVEKMFPRTQLFRIWLTLLSFGSVCWTVYLCSLEFNQLDVVLNLSMQWRCSNDGRSVHRWYFSGVDESEWGGK